MNKKQQTVIWIGVIVLILMILIPPWYYDYGQRGSKDGGYHLIFNAPSEYSRPRVNLNQLLLQILVVVVIAGSLVLAFKAKPHGEKE